MKHGWCPQDQDPRWGYAVKSQRNTIVGLCNHKGDPVSCFHWFLQTDPWPAWVSRTFKSLTAIFDLTQQGDVTTFPTDAYWSVSFSDSDHCSYTLPNQIYDGLNNILAYQCICACFVLSKDFARKCTTLLLQPKTKQLDKKEKQHISKQLISHVNIAGSQCSRSWERSSEDVSSTWTKQNKPHTASSKTRMSNLNVGSVTLALLLVDVQAELLAHLADLRSALSEEDPRRLALLSLIHIGCQVIQQLWEETWNVLSHQLRAMNTLSKDNFEKHFKYASFLFLVT